MPSQTICLAAVEIAIRPDEHCRSMVMPATEAGMPAAMAICRPTL